MLFRFNLVADMEFSNISLLLGEIEFDDFLSLITGRAFLYLIFIVFRFPLGLNIFPSIHRDSLA